MSTKKESVTSGVRGLDQLLEGGIFIGDNVVWYDDAGILASVFSLNLIQASLKEKKSLIYLSFDRSPKNLLEKIGTLAENQYLTILDCFTHGKGGSSDVFLDFYKKKTKDLPCRIICVEEPENADHVANAFYELHKTMKKDVRFIFESLTGMQELWGKEDDILKFYAHSCPRLYELNTIAYWIVEKEVHSQRLKAHLNKITQVAIDLSLKRGKTFLSILKAEKRDITILNKQTLYWSKGLQVALSPDKRSAGQIVLGKHVKELRTRRGLSQTDLAKQVGVTPSTISQVESNHIYPSLPALIKISEILSVNISYFLTDAETEAKVIFPESEATMMTIQDMSRNDISSKLLVPVGFDCKVEPYIIEISPGITLSDHFFMHKGEEIGYLLSGEIHATIGLKEKTIQTGDMIYLTSEIPSQWENKGKDPVRLLWLKVK
jgi:transcriptional regulator with XRE-family HTH domain/KaiC/GvpD/RAD55 family RecA-like ATPase/quercetin dioxygenase-like cupin family protein